MEHRKIIEALGGSTKLAKKLSVIKGKPIAVESVRCWKYRGFPAWFKAGHPDLIRKGKRLAGIK